MMTNKQIAACARKIAILTRGASSMQEAVAFAVDHVMDDDSLTSEAAEEICSFIAKAAKTSYFRSIFLRRRHELGCA